MSGYKSLIHILIIWYKQIKFYYSIYWIGWRGILFKFNPMLTNIHSIIQPSSHDYAYFGCSNIEKSQIELYK